MWPMAHMATLGAQARPQYSLIPLILATTKKVCHLQKHGHVPLQTETTTQSIIC